MDLRKIISLLMVSVLMLIGSGCSDDAAVKDGQTESSTQNAGLPPATLTFLITGEEKDDSREVLDRVAEKSGLNIKLDFKYFSDIYFRQVKTMIESGQKFDALYVGMPESYDMSKDSSSYVEMARSGVLKDITDLLPEYAPHIISQFDPKDLEAAKIDGRLYAVPSLFPEAKNISIILDADLVRKYDIGPVNTFEDYGVFLKTIKDNEKDIIPGQVSLYDEEMFMLPYGYILMDRALSLVYKGDDPDMKIVPWERTEEFRNVMSLLYDWQKNGYLARYDDGIEKTRASFLNLGGALKDGPDKMVLSGLKGSRVYEYYSYIMYKGVKLPRVNPMGNVFQKGAIALSANSGNAERTLMFLDWVQSSQENYDLLMYGIKDKHYTLEGDKLVFPAEEESGYPSYWHWLNSPFRNINYSRASTNEEYGADGFRNDLRAYMTERTFSAPHAGFYPDYRAVKAAADKRADLYQAWVTFAFVQEKFDPGQIDLIIQDLTRVGTDEIVNEIQRQLDQWRGR